MSLNSLLGTRTLFSRSSVIVSFPLRTDVIFETRKKTFRMKFDKKNIYDYIINAKVTKIQIEE